MKAADARAALKAQNATATWWRRWGRVWTIVGCAHATTHNLMVMVRSQDLAKQEQAAKQVADVLIAAQIAQGML